MTLECLDTAHSCWVPIPICSPWTDLTAHSHWDHFFFFFTLLGFLAYLIYHWIPDVPPHSFAFSTHVFTLHWSIWHILRSSVLEQYTVMHNRELSSQQSFLPPIARLFLIPRRLSYPSPSHNSSNKILQFLSLPHFKPLPIFDRLQHKLFQISSSTLKYTNTHIIPPPFS